MLVDILAYRHYTINSGKISCVITDSTSSIVTDLISEVGLIEYHRSMSNSHSIYSTFSIIILKDSLFAIMSKTGSLRILLSIASFSM